MRFFILSLALYRLTHLLASEAGPFGLLVLLRQVLSPVPLVGEVLACPYCLSVWLAVVVLFGDAVAPIGVDLLALSGLAMLCWEFAEGLRAIGVVPPAHHSNNSLTEIAKYEEVV